MHLVALAARTPVGLNAESTAAAIRAGISRVGEHPFLVDTVGEPVRCGRDRSLDAPLSGSRRLLALAASALNEVMFKLSASGVPGSQRVSLALALPENRAGFSGQDAAQVLHGLCAPSIGPYTLSVRAAAAGHAGVIQGMYEVLQGVATSTEELHILGGVDSYLDVSTLEWLDRDRRLARDEIRGGFAPGEAAAFVVLAHEALVRKWRLPSLAIVHEVAVARESRDETAPAGLLGGALGEVYLRATAALRQPGALIGDLYCDMNDERARTTDLSFALLRAGTRFKDASRYTTSVGQLGDVGAATAALNCVLAARSWARRYASGPLALISGASWTGLRGAIVLQETSYAG